MENPILRFVNIVKKCNIINITSEDNSVCIIPNSKLKLKYDSLLKCLTIHYPERNYPNMLAGKSTKKIYSVWYNYYEYRLVKNLLIIKKYGENSILEIELSEDSTDQIFQLSTIYPDIVPIIEILYILQDTDVINVFYVDDIMQDVTNDLYYNIMDSLSGDLEKYYETHIKHS